MPIPWEALIPFGMLRLSFEAGISNSYCTCEIGLLTTMFAAAASFLGRTNISQNYNIGHGHGGSRTSTPTPAGHSSTALPAAAHAPPFNVGPWRVQSATHKVRSVVRCLVLSLRSSGDRQTRQCMEYR